MLREYSQSNWLGGLSESDFAGQEGSVIEAVGVDIFSEPNAVKLSRKLTKETNSPTELCKFSVVDKFNNSYWFSASSGKIWYRTYLGVWSLAYTLADCSYFNGAGIATKTVDGYEYIYVAYKVTSTGLDALGYKKSVASGGATDWSDATFAWKTTGQKFYTAVVHPMVKQQGFLVIGNASYVATIDCSVADSGASFTYNGTPSVTLPAYEINFEVTALSKFGDDVLIGASQYGVNASATVQDYVYGLLSRWDLTSSGFTTNEEVFGNGIYALQMSPLGVYVFVGTEGTFYLYDGSSLGEPKSIRNSITGQDTSNGGYLINLKSVCNFGKYVLVGVSKNSLYSETFNEGIYVLGRKTSSFPLSIALQYPEPPFSNGSTYTYNLTGLSFGAIISIGSIFLAAYSDADATYGTTGVAVVETAKRNPSGYVRLNVTGNQDRSKLFEEFSLTYRKNTYTSAVSNLSLSNYYNNYAYGSAATSFTTNNEETKYNKIIVLQKIEATAIQPKINFVGDITKDETPVLTNFYCKFNEQEKT